jgi:hypothetical protein
MHDNKFRMTALHCTSAWQRTIGCWLATSLASSGGGGNVSSFF